MDAMHDSSNVRSHRIVRFIEEAGIRNSGLWVAEAKFGFSHVREKISALENPARILEVGCGSGILLSMLAEEFPQHEFSGIEPFGDGFAHLTELNAQVRKLGVNISIERYEEFEPEARYDLIYCVNVFEHVDDWQNFIEWASNNLSHDGLFFVLCPNYSFPYESHFKIPIVWNKKLTYRIFKKRINDFEQKSDFLGLWKSLNFVKKGEIKRFVKLHEAELEFSLNDEVVIIDDMVDRVVNDAEFRERQAILGKAAIFMKKIGVLSIVKWFPNFLPYMRLSFVRK